jgi:hypothetical protein
MERPVAADPPTVKLEAQRALGVRTEERCPAPDVSGQRRNRAPGTIDRRHIRPGRDRLVRFRYSTGEYSTVSDAARRAGYTVSGYAAEVALAAAGGRDDVCSGAGVDRDLLIALNAAREQVARIGTNLNQAVARFHATGEPPVWLDRVAALSARVILRLEDAAAEVSAGLAAQPRRRRGRRAA